MPILEVHGSWWIVVWRAMVAWGLEIPCLREGEHSGKLQLEVKTCRGRSASLLPA